MTDRDTREDEMGQPLTTEDALSEADEQAESAPSRARRSWQWWLGRVSLIVLFLAYLVLLDYGTMWPPSAAAEVEYQSLVAQGKAPPEPDSPGFRIPIPGCVCHAADADLATKLPGHVPDVTLVIAHRYRTLGQCFSAECHGGKTEAKEGPVPSEPENKPVVPAQ